MSPNNALAESTIGLYKTELIRQRGPWRDLDHTTFATLEYIDWYNHRRLHGGITPADHKTAYHQTTPSHPNNRLSMKPGAIHVLGKPKMWPKPTGSVAPTRK